MQSVESSPVHGNGVVNHPPPEKDWYAELRPKPESAEPIDSATGLTLAPTNGSSPEAEPVAQTCSRCHQPSATPVCDTCAEALDLLRALSGWE